MPVEPIYRIERIPNSGLRYSKAIAGQVALERLAQGCYLVPDTRLQAIADAWNEPHVADSVRLINSKFADVIEDALTSDLQEAEVG
jgi:hypothetical protein